MYRLPRPLEAWATQFPKCKVGPGPSGWEHGDKRGVTGGGEGGQVAGVTDAGRGCTCCARVPGITLSARALWLAAMNSGM